MQIEQFDTGLKIKKNIEDVEITPIQNLNNKKFVIENFRNICNTNGKVRRGKIKLEAERGGTIPVCLPPLVEHCSYKQVRHQGHLKPIRESDKLFGGTSHQNGRASCPRRAQ